MRYAVCILVVIAIAVTGLPSSGAAQSSLLLRNQQMQNQQRMMQQQRQQQALQRQQREAQRRQQAAQRRQMAEQRRRQQAAMQQRQRQMQVRQQQMQTQRRKVAEQRRMQQQRRQEEMQRKQAQRQQAVQKQAQQTARLARDRAVRLQRDRRLQQLRKRTRLQQQERQRQQAAQQTSTMALLSRQVSRAGVMKSPSFVKRRQAASQRFAKLREKRLVVRPRNDAGQVAAKRELASASLKQLRLQKLQQFRNKQALRGAKKTKQDSDSKVKTPKDFAKLSGILRDATKGKGNFNLGSANKEQALSMGKAWVGKDYRVASDGRTLISKDGLRQFRPPSPKKSSRATTGVQANFQRREFPDGNWTHNGHLIILK